MEQEEFSLLVGKQKRITTLEDSSAVSHETKHAFTVCFSNFTLLYLSKGVENLCPHTNSHTDVYTSFTHNWKQSKCPSTDEWINWYIYTMEYYSVVKRNELSSHQKTE